MRKYIGVKVVEATPETRGEFEVKEGRKVGGIHHGEGYRVTYDGGYQSWSPKTVFDEAYRPITEMTFGLAIEALKKGHKIARSGWNGKDMYVVYQKGYPDGIAVNKNTAEAYGVPEGTIMKFRPYMQLKTAQNDCAMWAPSGSDALAEDWMIVE
jgi:hypothetical protein